tara:strand:+ start:419 stop:673 length:255 start_codon:yes stop_codon:yes gene_type:complete
MPESFCIEPSSSTIKSAQFPGPRSDWLRDAEHLLRSTELLKFQTTILNFVLIIVFETAVVTGDDLPHSTRSCKCPCLRVFTTKQ